MTPNTAIPHDERACRAPAKAASAAAWLTWPPNTAGPTRRSLQAATRMSYATWRKFTDDGCNDECNEVVLDPMISTMMIRISSSHGLETSGMTPIDTLIPNQSTKTATKTDGKMKIGIAVHCILGCLLEKPSPSAKQWLLCEVKIPQMHVAQDIPRSIKHPRIRPTRVPDTSPALQPWFVMWQPSDNLQDRFSQLLTISGSACLSHSPRCWTLAAWLKKTHALSLIVLDVDPLPERLFPWRIPKHGRQLWNMGIHIGPYTGGL